MDGLAAFSAPGFTGVSAASLGASGDVFDGEGERSVTVRRFDDLGTVVVTKTLPGFDAEAVDACRTVLADCARSGRVKFLVFDFAQSHEAPDGVVDGFGQLVGDLANLILVSPVVSIALVRGPMRGADLELALACNMMLGEEGASFNFDADPLVSVRTYAFLAQKIGFVRTERMMENGQTLAAAEMLQLLLLKEVLEPGAVSAGLAEILRRYLRRHNFFYGIHRAQRIANPPVLDDFVPPARVV